MRVVVVGCGDVGLRLVRQFSGRANISATVRRVEQCPIVRGAGGRAIVFDLDRPGRRRRPEAIARHIAYLAPPNPTVSGEPRLAACLARMQRSGRTGPGERGGWPRPKRPPRIGAIRTQRLAYTSTTGVFGDAGGHLLTETDRPNPQSARAHRRLCAEQLLRARGRRAGRAREISASLFRAPGIYAADRLPLARLEASEPSLVTEQDSYSSHIHADDLARILWFGLFRGQTNRTYIASDGQRLKMGDYFDQIADATGLPRPPRLQADEVRSRVSPMRWSFMRESRQLSNARLINEFGIALRYPTVADTLRDLPLATESN